MTLKDLIAQLSKYNPDSIVMFYNDGYYTEVTTCERQFSVGGWPYATEEEAQTESCGDPDTPVFPCVVLY